MHEGGKYGYQERSRFRVYHVIVDMEFLDWSGGECEETPVGEINSQRWIHVNLPHRPARNEYTESGRCGPNASQVG